MKFYIGIILFSLLSLQLYSQDLPSTSLNINQDSANQLQCTKDGSTCQIITSDSDPYIKTYPLKVNLPDNHKVLSFEYFCPSGISDFQVFFGPPESESKSASLKNIDMAEGWTTYSVDLSDKMLDWGKPGDYLRLDLGRKPNTNIQMRNLRLRSFTDREKQIALQREAKKQRDAIFHKNLQTYLDTEFNCKIDKISANFETITISGTLDKLDNIYLCEIPPYLDVTDTDSIIKFKPIKKLNFSESFPRYQQRKDIKYDSLLSKWALAMDTPSGLKLISHAHYPDEIEPKYNIMPQALKGRKGIGGFDISRGHTNDLDDLDIASITVNIPFARFMTKTKSPGNIEHNYNGIMYYFNQGYFQQLDHTLLEAAKRNIIVAAILLIDKNQPSPDALLQHPDMDPSGIFSMPNMTTPESVNCYAAALDFLASRYSRPDKKYGRIHHWIMHNEVDAGWTWTNMGVKTDLVFMDTYIKSMRMCYAIARSYNPQSEVFISLTHYWAWTSHPHYYPSKDLMEILLKFSRVEGDFQWAVAHHPYPESLLEPKTWLDTKAKFNIDTPLITFKNLKVLDQWIKSTEMLYEGTQKRSLWLSENGTNSKSYSEKDLTEQAAGFAYTWKSMKDLDGIDGFQWHNWIDNRHEGGLRIGLRKFPDQTDDPAGRKPVWFLFQAADTDREDDVFAPYLKTIGIKKWSDIDKFQK